MLSSIQGMPGGEPIHQPGARFRGTLGGWFYSTRWRRAVGLTTAHVLSPVSVMALSGITPDDAPALLHREDDPEPFARVVEAIWTDDLAPVDGAIAIPLLTGLATSCLRGLGPIRVLAEPVAGQEVVLAASRGLSRGVVVSAQWRARQPGECRAVLVAAAGDSPFAVNGDSGALIVDPHRRAIVGMHTGQLDNLEIGGVRYASLWVAQPIQALLNLFDLRLLD